MKRTRIVGMCLVAVFALSALVASAASAAPPEYKTCIKAAKVGSIYPTGEFSNKTCKGAPEAASATTKYKLAEWNEGKKKFGTKGSGTNPINKQIFPALKAAVASVECSKEKSVGTLTGPKESTSTVSYSGCKSSEGKKCGKVGEASKGKIETQPLKTVLIAQTGSPEGVGIVVSPVTGSVLAVYECEGGLKVTAIGGVEGQVEGGAAEQAVKSVKLHFQHGTGVYQQWGYFGANEAENGEKFNEFFESEGAKGTPPNAFIVSHIEGNKNPALPEEFTLPATQEGVSLIKQETLKLIP